MKNILVTGGAGFIGSNLSEKLLQDGYNVIVVDNLCDNYSPEIKKQNISDFLTNKNYTFLQLDLLDVNPLENIFKKFKIDCVIHLAAAAGVRISIENPQKYISSNINTTVNLLELMKTYNVNKIIFSSSSSVYGECKSDKFSEDMKTSTPISPYAATKLACEQFIYTYTSLYDINAVILRFFTVYGPKQRPDLAICKFSELIKENKPITIYGDGTSMRDYTYIDDIVSGICLALNYSQTNYEIFNLGCGKPITLDKMVQTLEEALNKKANKFYLPNQLGDVSKTVCDISKAQRILNYTPKTTFSDGIKKYINWKFS